MLSYSKHTSYSPPSPYLLARWRKKLSSLEIHLAEAHIGDMLIERGYELSDDSPTRDYAGDGEAAAKTKSGLLRSGPVV